MSRSMKAVHQLEKEPTKASARLGQGPSMGRGEGARQEQLVGPMVVAVQEPVVQAQEQEGPPVEADM